MPRKPKHPRFDVNGPLGTLMYRNIHNGKWGTIKPKQLIAEDARYAPYYDNLSRMLSTARKRVANYKAYGTGTCFRRDLLHSIVQIQI